jgi:TonB family protein
MTKRGLALGLLLFGAGCASGGRMAVDVPVPPPTRPTQLVIQALGSADPTVRAASAWQLAGATELRAEAREALRPLLKDPDLAVRYATAWALGHLQVSVPGTAPAPESGSPPKAIQIIRPQYPQAAFAAKIQGTVLLDILIGESGEVAHAAVRKSIPELDAAALKCVRGWRFEPARVDGAARATLAQAPVSFRIY